LAKAGQHDQQVAFSRALLAITALFITSTNQAEGRSHSEWQMSLLQGNFGSHGH
jgi:hypothetical protein